MKIVHVFKDFYPPLAAGITCYIADVSTAMAGRGHDVEVHVAGVRQSRRERLPSGVVVHRHREVARALSMPLAPGLVREVSAVDAEVLHVHLPNPIGELGAARNHCSRVVATFHAQLGKQRFLEPIYSPLRNHLLNRATSVIVSGEALASSPELAAHRTKVRVLPYGVSPRMIGTRGRHGESPDSRLRFLFVGRLVYYKGVDVLLHALSRIEDATLDVVGSGAHQGRLEQLAGELGLISRVHFLGSLSDDNLARCYEQADVFVLPSISRAEAFGMAMAEAMANGLPVISTSLGTETDWVNDDQHTGLVVAANDADALAYAMNQMHDPERRRSYGEAARTRVRELLSFEAHVDRLEEIYHEALS